MELALAYGVIAYDDGISGGRPGRKSIHENRSGSGKHHEQHNVDLLVLIESVSESLNSRKIG